MATLQEATAARDLAFEVLRGIGVVAAVGITQAGLSESLARGETWVPPEGDPETATDYVLAVRLQEETQQPLPETIAGVPAEYEFIGIIRAY
jgi:hypothetical protein